MQHEISPGSPADWLRHARSDLSLAKLGKTGDILYNQLCFHTQQCAEKSIKAVLISKSYSFPKTHNIKVLSEILIGDSVYESFPIQAAILTEYSVESRYPTDVEEISELDYQNAVSLADQTYNWAWNIIRKLR